MKRILAIIVVALSCMSCMSAKGDDDTNHTTTCQPRFEPFNDWHTADGGMSVVLPNGRSVYLFGDSIVNNSQGALVMVGNSIAVGNCGADAYYWQDNRGFFDPSIDGIRLWPVNGHYHNDKLYVLLAKITNVDYGFGFDLAGTMFAVVDNPLDDPMEWNVNYFEFTQPNEWFVPTIGTFMKGSHLYMLSSLQSNNKKVYIRLDMNDWPKRNAEYLTRDDDFKNTGAYTEDAKIIFDEAPPSVYILYNSVIGKWYTIHASSTWGQPYATMQTSDDINGPWSPEKKIYEFPEMSQRSDVFCYAVFPHVQHSTDSKVVVTYSCNTSTLPEAQDFDLYRPHAFVHRMTPTPN